MAKKTAKGAIIMILMINSLIIALILYLREAFLSEIILINDIHLLLHQTFPFFMLYIFTEMLRDVIRNIMKSTLRYSWSFLSTLVCCYYMTLPMAY
jgi:Na+-driven multidrug efflux pump